jgi:phosphoglycolate phosphatase-like HAD superfamily hydrolase
MFLRKNRVYFLLAITALLGFASLSRLLRTALLLAVLLPVFFVVGSQERTAAQPMEDPLPSWKEGPNKKAITAFVKAVTTKDSPDFVPIEDRIATFDNDGTLWCEQPTAEIVFTLTRLKAMAAKDASLKEKQPFKAALEGDHEYLHKAGLKAILELVAATHGDMSQDEFNAEAREFFKTARHPKFKQPYPKMTYQPMVELLQYLRANGFQTWICSGGFMDLMRVFSEDSYGIPPSQVIGSSMKKKSMEKDGKRILFLLNQLLCICDQDDKPVEIGLHIDKRPILAAGNVRSGGDIGMLRYCQGSKYKSLQIMVNHDDDAREYAYAEKDRASLNAAEKYGWNVVSMKNDWMKVFAFDK